MKNIPMQIIQQRQQLDTLLKTGTTFGALVKFKDVCEVVLRLPVLCAGAFVLANSGEDKDMLTLALVRNRKLSIRNWMDIAHDLSKHSAVPKQLKTILTEVRDFFRKNNIAEWRNTEIAHGALRFDFSREFSRDFKGKVSSLEKLLKTLDKQYKSIAVSDDISTVTANGRTLPLMPYVHTESGEAYLFDSYGNGVAKGLCYALGVRRAIPGEAFVEISKQTKQKYVANSFSESDIEMEMSNIIDELNEAANFQYPMYLRDWLVESMNADGSGIEKGTMLLRMERGMGKSAFCRALDGRSIDDAYKAFKINGCFTRGYYCSRVGIRSAADFYAGVRSRLLTDENDQMLYSSEEHIPQLSENSAREDFAELLNWCHDRQRGRLLLIIDGIDEIPAEYISVLDKLPTADMLNTGVYILVTCRSQEIVPEKKPEEYTKEEKLALDENRQIELALSKIAADREVGYDRTDERNIAILKAYFENRVFTKKSKRPKEGDLLTLVREPGKMRFLEVRIIGALWRSEKITDFMQLVKVENLLEYYIRHIREEYGEYTFNRLVDMLVAIACAQEELTFGELAFLLGESGVTMQMLSFASDMAGILSVDRDYRGNHVGMASDIYRQWVMNRYVDSIYQHAMNVIYLLKNIVPEEGIENSDGVLAAIMQIQSYVTHAKISTTDDLVSIVHQIVRIVYSCNSDQEYVIRRKIKCLNDLEKMVLDTDYVSVFNILYKRCFLNYFAGNFHKAISDAEQASIVEKKLVTVKEIRNGTQFFELLFYSGCSKMKLNRSVDALKDFIIAEWYLTINSTLPRNELLRREILKYELCIKKVMCSMYEVSEDEIHIAYIDDAIDHFENSIIKDEKQIQDILKHLRAIKEAIGSKQKPLLLLSYGVNIDNKIALLKNDIEHGNRYKLSELGTQLLLKAIMLLVEDEDAVFDALDEAIRILKEAYDEGFEKSYIFTAYLLRAELHMKEENSQEALADCNELIILMEKTMREGDMASIQMAETLAEAFTMRASIYEDRTEYDLAVVDYRGAVSVYAYVINNRIRLGAKPKKRSDFAKAVYNLSLCLKNDGKKDEALQNLMDAIDNLESVKAWSLILPDLKQLYSYTGDFYREELHDEANAQKCYLKSITAKSKIVKIDLKNPKVAELAKFIGNSSQEQIRDKMQELSDSGDEEGVEIIEFLLPRSDLNQLRESINRANDSGDTNAVELLEKLYGLFSD